MRYFTSAHGGEIEARNSPLKRLQLMSCSIQCICDDLDVMKVLKID